jgi:hypothetical protein
MIPAVTAMSTYLSGVPYQEMYGSRHQASFVADRLDISMDLRNGMEPQTQMLLCESGVNLLWIEAPAPRIDLPALFVNEEVTIYQLDKDACAI